MRSLTYLVPVILFAVIAVFLGRGLFLDPSKVPTALADKLVPAFDLPAVDENTESLSSEDLKGRISVLNIFASWCIPCRVEHPLLLELAAENSAAVHGINYKDRPEDARNWLNSLGDPYDRIGADRDGRAGIDLGVYGVPETFVIDEDGVIRYKHVGPITEKDMNKIIRPLIQKLSER